MADNLRWWKLWTTAPSDSTLLSLPPAIRWAWAALGAHTVAHGDSGMLLTTPENPVLAAEMGVDPSALKETLLMLPNVTVEECKNRHGYLSVTWRNWTKYQRDSTQAERAKASRSKRRGEEKRGDKRRVLPPIPPNGGPRAGTARETVDAFETFWNAYPKERRRGRQEAIKAWRALRLTPRQIEQVMASLASWKASLDWQKESGKWIPWPQKFLNKRRWEETIEPPDQPAIPRIEWEPGKN